MIWMIIFVALILVGAWAAWAWQVASIADLVLHGTNLQNAAYWGDSFGAFNALFGTLGFSAVLATLVLQGRAFRQQQRDQHLQRFETTFFQLLDLMRELRNDVYYRYSNRYRQEKLSSPTGPQREKGTSAISQAIEEINHWRSQKEQGRSPLTKAEMGALYTEFVHQKYEHQFSPYFRIIYTILRRIRDDKLLSAAERAAYGNLLRSQLTTHEVVLAAYNGLTPVAKDFSDLITDFRILKYVPEGTYRRTLSRYYPNAAFASRD